MLIYEGDKKVDFRKKYFFENWIFDKIQNEKSPLLGYLNFVFCV